MFQSNASTVNVTCAHAILRTICNIDMEDIWLGTAVVAMAVDSNRFKFGPLPLDNADLTPDEVAEVHQRLEVERAEATLTFHAITPPGIVNESDGVLSRLQVVFLHNHAGGPPETVRSQFERDIRSKGYVSHVNHGTCERLAVQQKLGLYTWTVRSCLVRHAVTDRLWDHIASGGQHLDRLRFIMQFKQMLFEWSQRVERDSSGRPRDWVLMVRADQVQPDDSCTYLETLFEEMHAAMKSGNELTRDFAIVALTDTARVTSEVDNSNSSASVFKYPEHGGCDLISDTSGPTSFGKTTTAQLPATSQ